jgi:hypothetical protein
MLNLRNKNYPVQSLRSLLLDHLYAENPLQTSKKFQQQVVRGWERESQDMTRLEKRALT